MRVSYITALTQLCTIYCKRHFAADTQHTPKHMLNALSMLQNADMTLTQVPGAGRGLSAAKVIKQGTQVHAENPMICYPSISQACHNCLKPVTDHSCHTDKGVNFCSKACHLLAMQQYFGLEQLLDSAALQQHCQAYGESFPMLAMRAACQHLQQAILPSNATPQADPMQAYQSQAFPQGDIWQDYKFLTFARIPPPPPPPWVDAHGLLSQALQRYTQNFLPTLPVSQQETVNAAVADLNLEWYVDLLSRLHINSFRVDGIPVPQPSAAGQGLSLAGLAAAAVAGSEEGRLGTAIYLLASLFNHSCTPNVDVTFPFNNSTAVFVAAHDIEPAEELCISYIDASQNIAARQQQLQWAYGFTCQCQACLEEL